MPFPSSIKVLLWEVSRWAPAKSVGRGARRTRGTSEPHMCVAFNTSLLGVRKHRKKKARQVDLRRPRVVTMYIAQNPKWKSCFHSKSISCNGVKKVGAFIMFNTNIHTERTQILSVQLKGSYTNSVYPQNLHPDREVEQDQQQQPITPSQALHSQGWSLSRLLTPWTSSANWTSSKWDCAICTAFCLFLGLYIMFMRFIHIIYSRCIC